MRVTNSTNPFPNTKEVKEYSLPTKVMIAVGVGVGVLALCLAAKATYEGLGQYGWNVKADGEKDVDLVASLCKQTLGFCAKDDPKCSELVEGCMRIELRHTLEDYCENLKENYCETINGEEVCLRNLVRVCETINGKEVCRNGPWGKRVALSESSSDKILGKCWVGFTKHPSCPKLFSKITNNKAVFDTKIPLDVLTPLSSKFKEILPLSSQNLLNPQILQIEAICV